MNDRAKPDVRTNDPTSDAGVARADMKFEVSSSPFRRSTRLYADYDSGKDFRVIQFTPPGSGCLIISGKNVTPYAHPSRCPRRTPPFDVTAAGYISAITTERGVALAPPQSKNR
jgi:hypothetical protein